MLLHLGKHRLGQKDNIVEEASKSNALVQILLDEIMKMKEDLKKVTAVEQVDKKEAATLSGRPIDEAPC